jgi:hypothetical protein
MIQILDALEKIFISIILFNYKYCSSILLYFVSIIGGTLIRLISINSNIKN